MTHNPKATFSYLKPRITMIPSADGVVPTETIAFAPADLAPVPAGITADNLLLAANAQNELILTMDFPWSATVPELEDTLQIFIDGNPVGPARLVNEFDGIAPVELTIPAGSLLGKEGTHELKYQIVYTQGSGAEFGPAISFAVDFSAPGNEHFLASPEFTQDIYDDGVTPEKLIEVSGKQYLPGLIAGYQGMAAGDKIIAYIDSEAVDTIEVSINDVDSSIHINYPREIFERVGDGLRTITYKVTDRAGNLSDPSHSTLLSVILAGAAEDLEAPIVPLFDDDSLINDTDARAPVVTQIPGNDKIIAGDLIRLHWGNTVLPDIPVPTGNVGADPVIEINVPYATVNDEWNKTGDTMVKVWYELYRGVSRAGTSDEAEVIVNLEIAGGPDPDPETPINENLLAPTVESASGEENEIPVEDSALPAMFIIPWMDAQNPAENVFNDGDIIHPFYGNSPLPDRPVNATDITNATDIEVELSAALIKTEGTGLIPARYEIERVVSGTVSSTALSPSQDVDVKSQGDLPGEGHLDQGTYLELNANGVINKDVAPGGVPFEIPLYANKAIGDVIDITFNSYHYRDSGFVTPIGTQTVQLTVSANDVGGVTVVRDVVTEAAINALLGTTVPNPRGYGYAHTVYTITNASGSVTSDEAIVIIDIR